MCHHDDLNFYDLIIPKNLKLLIQLILIIEQNKGAGIKNVQK